ncbi:MAG: LAGLIDADG family homing endonuclease, partial [Candidatus Diapherotrites archaeon]|nr:LAGLIDADG family homing endonuclease [Candidatus Diapherotrites archaeon]
MNSFLNSVFEVNRGTKRNLRIPKLIRGNKDLLRHYIAGLYDADGTLPKHPREAKQLFLDITLKDKEFIEEIQLVLTEFGIKTLKLYERFSKSPQNDSVSSTWEIRIRRQADILKFLNE